MIFTFIATFIFVFFITFLFKNLNFVYDKTNRLILDSLDTTALSWSSSLFVYCFIFNSSIEFVGSAHQSTYLLINVTACIFFLLLNGYIHSEYVQQYVKISKRKRPFTKRNVISLLIYSLILTISLLVYNSAVWLIATFGKVSIEQLLFSMQTLSGSNNQQVFDYFDGPIITTLFLVYLFVRLYLFFHYNNLTLVKLKRKKKKRLNKFLFPVISILVLFISLFLSIEQVGLAQVRLYFSDSELIKDEYVNPNKTTLSFPTKKRNLIYIYVESLEASYTSKALGGAQKDNLLEPLTRLIKDDNQVIHFSNTEKLGGALQVPGAEYTAAGIVSQTAGMPLKVPQNFVNTEELGLNSFGMEDNFSSGETAFLPGLTSLGDILKKQHYNQTFVMGSDATFGGRRAYLTQHGAYDIVDLFEARKRGYIPTDYSVWWGYEDEKVFSIAQKEVTNLAAKDEPFNLTMLTSDTHFPNGYITEKTPTPYEDQYSNVIANSSQEIADFIKWCQQQPFYENTTIVISGDHLTMDQHFIDSLPKNYERTVFNLFINAPIAPTKTENRQFTNLDMFPTTLASLGVDISTNRLGIGTNLFSDKKTIVEKYSIDVLREELAKQSTFYTQNILKTDKQQTTSSSKKEQSQESSQSQPASTEKPEETASSSSQEAVSTPPADPAIEEHPVPAEE